MKREVDCLVGALDCEAACLHHDLLLGRLLFRLAIVLCMAVPTDHHLVELGHAGRSSLHVSNYAPILHDVDAIAEFEDFVESMRHENETGTPLESANPC